MKEFFFFGGGVVFPFFWWGGGCFVEGEVFTIYLLIISKAKHISTKKEKKCVTY